MLAQRLTYVGELGCELYVPRGWAVQVWDAILAAGRDHDIRVAGYRTLEGLQMEKGYRYFGVDLTSLDNPFEAGLGFCVWLDKGDFLGREALVAAKEAPLERRLRTLLVGSDDEYLTLYGGAAVLLDRAAGGRLRSCAYGFTLGRNIAYAYLPAEIEEGDRLEVQVFEQRVPAEVAADILYDEAGERARA